MPHLVLLGDSIFDNAAYTEGGPDVVTQVREVLPRGWSATLLAVDACLRPRLPLAVCTIYNGCFPDPQYQRVVSTALTVFNDAILRVALEHGLPVVDLRAVCAKPEDYANPIEPSSVGGEKIARAMAGLVTGPNVFDGATRVVVG